MIWLSGSMICSSAAVEVEEKVGEAVAGMEGRDAIRSSSLSFTVIEDGSIGKAEGLLDDLSDTMSGRVLRPRRQRSDFRCSIQLDDVVDDFAEDDSERLVQLAEGDLRSRCLRARLKYFLACLNLERLLQLFDSEVLPFNKVSRLTSSALLLPLPFLGVLSSISSSDDE